MELVAVYFVFAAQTAKKAHEKRKKKVDNPCAQLENLLRNQASVDFGVLLSRVFDSFCEGCINISYTALAKRIKNRPK